MLICDCSRMTMRDHASCSLSADRVALLQDVLEGISASERALGILPLPLQRPQETRRWQDAH